MREDAVCYNHENRPAAVACQRCERPVCASCMNQASVGFHCPECAKTGAQKVYRGIGSSTSDPIFTKIILGLIAATYIFQFLGAGRANSNLLVLFGPLVQDGELWRIVTSAFAHAGLIHIGFNAYLLWIFGQQLEPLLGRFKFGLIYAGGLFGGSLAVLLFNFDISTLGASGAVLGLAGAMAVIYQKNGFGFFNSPVGFLIIANLGFPLIVGGISFWGHLGGLVGGALVALLVSRGGSAQRDPGQLVGGVLAVLALAGAAVYVGLTDPLMGVF